MRKLGQKRLTLQLHDQSGRDSERTRRLRSRACRRWHRVDLHLRHAETERTGITTLLADLSKAGIKFNDLQTRQSSLEEIFVDLVREGR